MRHSASNACSSCVGQPLAQLDEVAPARSAPGASGPAWPAGSKSRVVRQRRVAAHAVVVLHPALGGQAVVVPAHRVEDLLAAHPLEAGDQVGVGVARTRARRAARRTRSAAGCRSRRSSARVRGAVEAVGALLAPALCPGLVQAVQGRLVRDGGRAGVRCGCSRCGGSVGRGGAGGSGCCGRRVGSHDGSPWGRGAACGWWRTPDASAVGEGAPRGMRVTVLLRALAAHGYSRPGAVGAAAGAGKERTVRSHRRR